MKLFLRGNTWWVSHGTGDHRIRQSTGRTDRDEAEKVAKEICAPSMLQREADIVEVAGKIASGKRKAASESTAGRTKIADCLEAFPLIKADGSQPVQGTLVVDSRAWRKMTAYFAEHGVEFVHEVTHELAKSFLASLSQGVRDLTYAFCRSRFHRMGVEPNPFRDHKSVNPHDKKHHEPLTDEELHAVMKQLDDPTWRISPNCASRKEFAMYFRFLLYTGLRTGDAATTKVSQCDFEHEVIRRKIQKTGKIVEFPMHHVLRDILPRQGEYLFPVSAAQCQKSGNTTRISSRCRTLFIKLGIWRGKGVICAHSLRATFATICCEAGVPLAVIQSWLGHSSTEITRIYAHFNDMKKKREAIEKFPEF